MKRLKDPSLVPSSMNATNTVAEDASLAMTAPGSASVLPAPASYEQDVLPQPELGSAIPVNNVADRVEGNPAPAGQDAGGGWVNVSSSGTSKSWHSGPGTSGGYGGGTGEQRSPGGSGSGHVKGAGNPNANK